jgi:hypothetical protein
VDARAKPGHDGQIEGVTELKLRMSRYGFKMRIAAYLVVALAALEWSLLIVAGVASLIDRAHGWRAVISEFVLWFVVPSICVGLSAIKLYRLLRQTKTKEALATERGDSLAFSDISHCR